MIRVAVIGAAGRMGRAVVEAVAAAEDLELACAVVRTGSPSCGVDAGEIAGIGPLGVRCSDTLGSADVAIEFTGAGCLDRILSQARMQAVPLVSGSTGLDAAQRARLEAFASEIPTLWAPNLSLGVQWLYRLVAMAAQSLGADADIEVLDWHHRGKADAPSGTALALAACAAEARGQDPADVIRTDRHGADASRRPGEIGVSAIRAGDVIGEHTVAFGMDSERIEITHRASDRLVFVRGALAAARFLAGRSAGLYTLADVLEDRPGAC